MFSFDITLILIALFLYVYCNSHIDNLYKEVCILYFCEIFLLFTVVLALGLTSFAFEPFEYHVHVERFPLAKTHSTVECKNISPTITAHS